MFQEKRDVRSGGLSVSGMGRDWTKRCTGVKVEFDVCVLFFLGAVVVRPAFDSGRGMLACEG